MIPGLFHCRGCIGIDHFDGMTALINWVEKGVVPDSIPGGAIEGGRVSRTRPLCPHAQLATYSGQGSVDDAANFACRPPR
jgi:feruloyl esterase